MSTKQSSKNKSKVKTQLSAIGLDIDAHEFRAVQLMRSPEGISTVAWATFPRREEMQSGDPLDAPAPPDGEELEWAGAILGRRGFVGNAVSISPSTKECSSHVIDLPPSDSGAPIEQLARMEIARERRCGPDEFELGHWTLPAKGRTQESLAVACPRTVIDETVERFELGGLVIGGLDLMELAVCRGVQAGEIDQGIDNEINSMLHVGWGSSLAVLTLGGSVVYVRRIERGASSVWEQCLGRYRLSARAGERVLNDTNHGDDAKELAKIKRSVWTSLASELASELDVAVAYVSHSYRMAPLGKIRLCGYSAGSSVIEEQLDKTLGIPMINAAPPALVEGIGSGHDVWSLASRLTLSYGLAERFDR